MSTVVISPWLDDSVWGMVHQTTFATLIFLGVWAHYKAVTTDPGAVPHDAVPIDHEPGDDRAFKVCVKCNSFKPSLAHHCSICKRCVVKMDHHCPWVNNCVGLANHKFFLQFLLYVFLVSVYALVFTGAKFVHCIGHSPSRRRSRLRGQDRVTESAASAIVEGVFSDSVPSTPGILPECNLSIGSNMIVMFLVVEALLFGLFTLCMMCDQWGSVLTSVSKIDRYKGVQDESVTNKRDLCENLTRVFGGEPRFSLSWFIPTDVVFVRPDSVRGYRQLEEVSEDIPFINKA